MPIPPDLDTTLTEAELAAIAGSGNYPSCQWLMRRANMETAAKAPMLPEALLDEEQDAVDQMMEIFGGPFLLGC